MPIDLVNHLKELEESHIRIDVRKSREKLGEILADDFFEIGSSGYIFYKEECLESAVLSECSLYNFEIFPLSEGVILTTYFIVDHTRNRNTLRSSIWKVIDGRWQLYFHQGTITPLEVSDVITSKVEK
ncbi:nuclear transport factor 2 family protein [Metabacillus sp. JX24]|uniref:nuclear transport factor 2 family protein n=1 Tax=Metabacillus sp. JX24 TaxID=3240759 RepID=UPI00350F5BEB